MSSLTPSTQNTPASVRAELSRQMAQAQLEGKTGRRYWRSLDELSRDESFGDLLHAQFPRFAAEWDPMHRRDFIRLMGASLALGGLTACTRQPTEKIIPYVKQPEYLVPGKAMYYATTMPLQGYGVGLLATSHMGRPTKLDGNEKHPACLGGSDALIQAAILSMYDPDRAKTIKYKGRTKSKTWSDFYADLKKELETLAAKNGEGLHLLTGTVTSPTLASTIQAVLDKYPAAVWHQYEPINRDRLYEATQRAYGRPLDPVYDIAKADVIVSLDADFIGMGPAHLRYARDYASRRDVEAGNMNRLYVAESHMTLTGAAADHRLALTPDALEQLARAVAAKLGVAVNGPVETAHGEWADAVVADLKAHAGKALVIAGEHRSASLQSLVFAINEALGNVGETLSFIEPSVVRPGGHMRSLAELADAMEAGKVKALLMFDVNPVYHAPAAMDFGIKIRKVPFIVDYGLFETESSEWAHYQLPGTHFLEAWGDCRAYDGTASIVQPLIEPLYDGRSALEILAFMAGNESATGYDLVRETWAEKLGGDLAWKRALHDGVVEGSAAAPVRVDLAWRDSGPDEQAAPEGELDLAILPDYATLDGSFANNGWMQEMPRPITTLTWDNALLISQETAEKLGLSTGDVVEASTATATVKMPVLVAVGIPVGGGVVTLGYGRRMAGRVGNGVGFSVAALQVVESPARAFVKIAKTRETHTFALTQEHHAIEGRNHLRVGTVADFQADNAFVWKFDEFSKKYGRNENAPSIYPPHDYSQGPQWGMVINLSSCIGCNACMIACQAENNIPVVGKEEVANGREMHWIRVDRYYEGKASHAAVHHQPMTCVHCENAPCEAVCPVAATVHSTDGLNQMVYNRCVGTRYCSNNCPYKVRRFNFYKYADHETPSLKLQRNPNVTVRARGVMEKCTFCIQRISEARINARVAGRPIADGEVVTACQQACPTKAIVFGDIRDATSEVARKKESTLDYGVLSVLNTRPRLTYHARIRNPNMNLETASVTESISHGA
ncbi:MAG TPA: TAT-variant-translocated molybdopterin oxidoreductase [Kiritimatiellia bacterium]|nr:TAT-variant-translocated molybdopterin oxidoreductase [Kiritimatiellia bacterium]